MPWRRSSSSRSACSGLAPAMTASWSSVPPRSFALGALSRPCIPACQPPRLSWARHDGFPPSQRAHPSAVLHPHAHLSTVCRLCFSRPRLLWPWIFALSAAKTDESPFIHVTWAWACHLRRGLNEAPQVLVFGRSQPLERKRLVVFGYVGKGREPPCLGAPVRGAAHDAAANRRVARCPPRQVSCRPQPDPRRCEQIECVLVVGALPASVCAQEESLQLRPLLASRRSVGAPPALAPDGCRDQLAGMRASGCCQHGVPAPSRRRER